MNAFEWWNSWSNEMFVLCWYMWKKLRTITTITIEHEKLKLTRKTFSKKHEQDKGDITNILYLVMYCTLHMLRLKDIKSMLILKNAILIKHAGAISYERAISRVERLAVEERFLEMMYLGSNDKENLGFILWVFNIG